MDILLVKIQSLIVHVPMSKFLRNPSPVSAINSLDPCLSSDRQPPPPPTLLGSPQSSAQSPSRFPCKLPSDPPFALPPKTLLRALPRPPLPGIPAGLPHRLPSQGSPQGALRAPHKVPTPGLLSDAPLRAPSQGPPQGSLRAPLGIPSGLLRGGLGGGI